MGVVESAPRSLREQQLLCADNNANAKQHNTDAKRQLVDRLDWIGFRTACIPTNVCGVIADVHSFISAITAAATEHIPRSGVRSSKPLVPWWNNALKDAITEMWRGLNRYKRAPTKDNHIAFKRLRAVARRIILAAKRSNWETYVSSITRSTTVTDRLYGRRSE